MGNSGDTILIADSWDIGFRAHSGKSGRNGADIRLICWVLLTLGGEAGRLMPWHD